MLANILTRFPIRIAGNEPASGAFACPLANGQWESDCPIAGSAAGERFFIQIKLLNSVGKTAVAWH